MSAVAVRRVSFEVPAGAQTPGGPYRTQVWTDPESHALARDASGEPHSSGPRGWRANFWRAAIMKAHATFRAPTRQVRPHRLRRRDRHHSDAPRRRPSPRLRYQSSVASRSMPSGSKPPSRTSGSGHPARPSHGLAWQDAAGTQPQSQTPHSRSRWLDRCCHEGVRDADRRDRDAHRRRYSHAAVARRIGCEDGAAGARRVARRARRRIPLHHRGGRDAADSRELGHRRGQRSPRSRVESSQARATPETPQTIQVIPRTLLDEQGATTLSDALRNVPGITMQAGEGGGASNTSGDMFNMRGFSANNSLFVDGVRDDGLIARDVYNLEQIEVFSGPTGSDVGRTNAAGYINLTTKAAATRPSRSGTFSYGAGEQVRATVDVNQPLSLAIAARFFGEAAVRVNALWQDGGVAGRITSSARARRSRRRSRSASTRRHAQRRRAGYAAGQPRRLRTARRRVARRPADLRRRLSPRPRWTSRTTTAVRTSTTTAASRTTSAPARARLPRRPDAPQPDPLQHDHARGGHHEHRESRRRTTRRRIS